MASLVTAYDISYPACPNDDKQCEMIKSAYANAYVSHIGSEFSLSWMNSMLAMFQYLILVSTTSFLLVLACWTSYRIYKFVPKAITTILSEYMNAKTFMYTEFNSAKNFLSMEFTNAKGFITVEYSTAKGFFSAEYTTLKGAMNEKAQQAQEAAKRWFYLQILSHLGLPIIAYLLPRLFRMIGSFFFNKDTIVMKQQTRGASHKPKSISFIKMILLGLMAYTSLTGKGHKAVKNVYDYFKNLVDLDATFDEFNDSDDGGRGPREDTNMTKVRNFIFKKFGIRARCVVCRHLTCRCSQEDDHKVPPKDIDPKEAKRRTNLRNLKKKTKNVQFVHEMDGSKSRYMTKEEWEAFDCPHFKTHEEHTAFWESKAAQLAEEYEWSDTNTEPDTGAGVGASFFVDKDRSEHKSVEPEQGKLGLGLVDSAINCSKCNKCIPTCPVSTTLEKDKICACFEESMAKAGVTEFDTMPKCKDCLNFINDCNCRCDECTKPLDKCECDEVKLRRQTDDKGYASWFTNNSLFREAKGVFSPPDPNLNGFVAGLLVLLNLFMGLIHIAGQHEVDTTAIPDDLSDFEAHNAFTSNPMRYYFTIRFDGPENNGSNRSVYETGRTHKFHDFHTDFHNRKPLGSRPLDTLIGDCLDAMKNTQDVKKDWNIPTVYIHDARNVDSFDISRSYKTDLKQLTKMINVIYENSEKIHRIERECKGKDFTDRNCIDLETLFEKSGVFLSRDPTFAPNRAVFESWIKANVLTDEPRNGYFEGMFDVEYTIKLDVDNSMYRHFCDDDEDNSMMNYCYNTFRKLTEVTNGVVDGAKNAVNYVSSGPPSLQRLRALKMSLTYLLILDETRFSARLLWRAMHHCRVVGNTVRILQLIARYYLYYRFARFLLDVILPMFMTKQTRGTSLWDWYDSNDFKADWERPKNEESESDYDMEKDFMDADGEGEFQYEKMRNFIYGKFQAKEMKVKIPLNERPDFQKAISKRKEAKFVPPPANNITMKQQDGKIFNPHRFAKNVGHITLGGELLTNAFLTGRVAFIVKHAYESLPKSFDITTPYANIKIQKEKLVLLPNKDLMWVEIPTTRTCLLRAPSKIGESCYIVQYTPRSNKNNQFELSSGYLTPSGWHTALTEDGSCTAPLIGSDGAILGFHHLGNKLIRKCVVVDDEIMAIVKSLPVAPLQSKFDNLN